MAWRSVAAALALVAALAVAASAAPQPAGFDVLASLISRVKENIDATHRVTVAAFQQEQERCAAALAPVQSEIDARQATLNASEARIAAAKTETARLTDGFAPLNEKIAAAMLEQGRFAKRVRDGDQQREAEQAIVNGKLESNAQLVDTLGKLLDRLAEVNVTQFQFREVLQREAASAKDQAAGALMADAAAALSEDPQVVRKAGDEVTVARLRTLLSLLRAELQQYSQSVAEHDKEAAADWKDHRDKLTARVDELYKEVKAADEAKLRLVAQIAEQKKIVETEQAVLDGQVPKEMAVWQGRKDAIVAQCELRRKHFQAEEQARQNQASTIAALTKLSEAHADSDSDLGIGGITVPKPAACCSTCSGSTPVACGDQCMSREVAATARCRMGCACSEGDPRLAAAAVF